MDLATLLHPHGVADFLVRIYGTEPLRVPGAAARFSCLWPASVALSGDVDLASADQTFPHLADLATVLERTFETGVNFRLRAGLRNSPEFTTGHDRLVLGIEGNSSWTLGEVSHAVAPGTLLYIPQGELCRVSGGGAELHIEILNPTGYDLVSWVVNAMRDQPAMRAAMPLLAGPDRRADFTQAARKLVANVMRSVELFEKFERHRFSTAAPRALACDVFDPSQQTAQLMLLAANYPLRPKLGEDDSVYIAFHGHALRFGVEAAPFIHYLNHALPAPVAAFYRNFADDFTQPELAEFLAVAAQAGLIVFRNQAPSGGSQ